MTERRKIQASITIFRDSTTVHAVVCQGDAYTQHASEIFDYRDLLPNRTITEAEAIDRLMVKVAELVKGEIKHD